MADWDVVGTAPYTPPTPQQRPADDPFAALEQRADQEQQRQVQGGGGPSSGGTLGEIAAGVWHGVQKAMPGMDVLHKDPKTGQWVAGEAQPEEKLPDDWTSSISEFAGSLAGGGPGGVGKLGGAARAVESEAPGVASRVGRALGIGAGERGTVPLAQGSLEEARARDAALGTLGRRGVSVLGRDMPGLTRAAQATERVSAELPGGGAIKRAEVGARTRSAELTTGDIANRLVRGQERVIATERDAYQTLSNADRMQVAAFWRVGGPDHVFQALQRSGQDPQMLRLIQQATPVLNAGSRRYIASEMLNRMGRDANGVFSAETFLQNWGRISPGAQAAVFGERAIGTDFARNMTELATNIEQIQAYASRTPMSMLRSIPHRGVLGIATAAGAAGGAIAVGVQSIIHGLLSPKLAAGVAGLSVSNLTVAQALTNPSTVKWLAAQSAKMLASYESAQDKYQYSEMPSTLH